MRSLEKKLLLLVWKSSTQKHRRKLAEHENDMGRVEMGFERSLASAVSSALLELHSAGSLYRSKQLQRYTGKILAFPPFPLMVGSCLFQYTVIIM